MDCLSIQMNNKTLKHVGFRFNWKKNETHMSIYIKQKSNRYIVKIYICTINIDFFNHYIFFNSQNIKLSQWSILNAW